MKKYPKSIEDCIKELTDCASNANYAEIESLLTWSAAYLKDYSVFFKKIEDRSHEVKFNDGLDD